MISKSRIFITSIALSNRITANDVVHHMQEQEHLGTRLKFTGAIISHQQKVK